MRKKESYELVSEIKEKKKGFILFFSFAQARTFGTFSLTKEWTFIMRRTWNQRNSKNVHSSYYNF